MPPPVCVAPNARKLCGRMGGSSAVLLVRDVVQGGEAMVIRGCCEAGRLRQVCVGALVSLVAAGVYWCGMGSCGFVRLWRLGVYVRLRPMMGLVRPWCWACGKGEERKL